MSNKVYLFDFDGTLVDSMPYWMEKVMNILRISKVEYPADIIKIITPLGDLGTAKYFKDVLGVPFSLDKMFDMMDAYALDKYANEIVLKQGVYECLKQMKEKGYSLNVLTASPHKMLDPCLKRNGVWELFDHIWSCDDFSTTKADPKIYTEAARRLGVEPGDVVFFDDNIGAIRTAQEAGLITVGVYDPTGEDFAQELKAVADRYILSFEEWQK